VPIATLDSLLDDVAVDLIKIDVEGHELEVLRGAHKVLDRVPALDIEVHCGFFRNPLQTLHEILRSIRVGRYECFVQDTVDGAIVACDLNDDALRRLAQLPVINIFCRALRDGAHG
jgi:hypothetical protein